MPLPYLFLWLSVKASFGVQTMPRFPGEYHWIIAQFNQSQAWSQIAMHSSKQLFCKKKKKAKAICGHLALSNFLPQYSKTFSISSYLYQKYFSSLC